jgi:hypothetical protein
MSGPGFSIRNLSFHSSFPAAEIIKPTVTAPPDICDVHITGIMQKVDVLRTGSVQPENAVTRRSVFSGWLPTTKALCPC